MRTRRRAVRPLPAVWVMAVALVAVAANLRIAITSVPPLLDAISTDLGLSHAAAGALTTLPVLCMGVFAPVASRIAHRTGAAGAVLGAVIGILAGTASRFAGDHVVVLYAGTFVCGVGIAVAGTLLPRLVKTYFPARAHRSRHRPLHAGDDGRRRAELGDRRASRRPARQLAGLARLVVGRRPRRRPRLGPVHGARQPPPHARRGGARSAPVGTPHGLARRRLPRPAVLVLLLRRHVARPHLRRARLVP